MHVHIEGRDTIWSNADAIARALHIDVYELVTFFSAELEVSTRLEMDDYLVRVVISGIHSDASLRHCLDMFIETNCLGMFMENMPDDVEEVEDTPTYIPALGLDEDEYEDEEDDDDYALELSEFHKKRLI
jgi:hypothetical protein